MIGEEEEEGTGRRRRDGGEGRGCLGRDGRRRRVGKERRVKKKQTELRGEARPPEPMRLLVLEVRAPEVRVPVHT